MIAIDVLVIGHLERDAEGNTVKGETFSTSTLIRCPGRNIVVDTSGEIMRPGIKTSLRQIGKVFPEDVDTVVLTHSHPDHVGNNSMFPKARFLIHSGEELEGAEVIEGDVCELCKGVKLVHTPGHTAGSMSVFVEGDDRRYVIAGDAVPLKNNILKGVPPRLNIDGNLAMASMERISRWADVIIPGHGPPFINPKRPRSAHIQIYALYRRTDTMADELPDTIVYECPDCRDVTEHKILKARLGNSNVTGTFRCNECGRIFTGTIRLPKPLAVKVMVSTGDTTDSTETALLESEVLEVGDEFTLDDGRNVCITQIVDKGFGSKRKKVQAAEIKEIWVKDYDDLAVKVSVNDNTRTWPMYTSAEPDDEFAIGMMMHFEKWDAVITSIKTKERLIRRGSAEARDISRIYCKIVRHGQTDSEEGEVEELSDGSVMDFDDE